MPFTLQDILEPQQQVRPPPRQGGDFLRGLLGESSDPMGERRPGSFLLELAAAQPAPQPAAGGGGPGGMPGGVDGLLELFYGGNKFNPSSVDPTHQGHLHVADEHVRKILNWIAGIPGFEVGEHPAFGGVAPVHVEGSHHYRNDAGDVNYTGGGRFRNEAEALNWLEHKLARRYG